MRFRINWIINFLLCLLVVLFPLGQIGRLYFYVSSSRITVFPSDIIVPVVLALWVLAKLLKRDDLRWNSVHIAIILFSIACIVSLVAAAGRLEIRQVIVSSLYTIRWVALASLCFVISDTYKSLSKVRTLFYLMFSTGIVVGFLGILQYLFMPDMSKYLVRIAGGGWDAHNGRMVSTFLDPNFLGGYIIFLLSIALNYVFVRDNTRDKRLYRFFIFSILLFSLCIVLTFSRAALLAYIVVIAAVIIRSIDLKRIMCIKKKVVFLVVIFVAVLSVSMPSLIKKFQNEPVDSGYGAKIDTSAYCRIATWKSALFIVRNNVLGIGYNTYAFETGKIIQAGSTGPQNSLLLILATTGILGFTIYIYMLFAIVGFCKRIYYDTRFSEELRAIVLGYAVGLIALVVHSMFIDSLTYIFIMEMMWIMMGAIIAWQRIEYNKIIAER